MVGIPKIFNTRSDIEICMALAQSGGLDKDKLKAALAVLLGDEFVLQVKTANVAADYQRQAGETVVEERDMITGAITYNVLAPMENPNSRLRLVLGMTPDEIRTQLASLDAMTC